MTHRIRIGLATAVTAATASLTVMSSLATTPHLATTASLAAASPGPAKGSSGEQRAGTPHEAEGDVPPVGTTPPEWQSARWLHSPPLALADLRGKVVLVRWWTAGCPYCATTAPALRELHQTYGPRGLVVVGMYHHKGPGPFDPSVYEETARKYGFTFPLAVDPEWKTLKSWMNGVDTGFTSVTFLLDKKGVVRWFHPGGEYKTGDQDYSDLTTTIEHFLAQH